VVAPTILSLKKGLAMPDTSADDTNEPEPKIAHVASLELKIKGKTVSLTQCDPEQTQYDQLKGFTVTIGSDGQTTRPHGPGAIITITDV
jgi:hypothetical protein